jgi:DEAD/DEAH box helicase domain-containing protein
LAQRGFEIILELFEKTRSHVKSCECEDGCPSCIHSPKCGSGNKPLDKRAALLILDFLLGHIPLSEITMEEAEIEPPISPEAGGDPEAKKEPRLLYLDLETQKLAQEVGGWQNTHLMRVSVVVVFDSVEKHFRVFTEDSLEELFALLQEVDLIIGFNIKKFDYRVLGAYTNGDLKALPTFDILENIHNRLGFRLGLDHLATETLKRGKTADGLQAVEWFRQGEMEKLTDYCRQDVEVTRDLFQFGLKNGQLIYKEKRSGQRLRLLVNWNLEDMLNKP